MPNECCFVRHCAGKAIRVVVRKSSAQASGWASATRALKCYVPHNTHVTVRILLFLVLPTVNKSIQHQLIAT
jgi:hypothetical protein